ncbi:hypothetical protein BV898_01489 [Hypsibius exemplaris]|uniref:Protein rolling stone n=1 Tax=Hypsibius exemplaris TaxID=2072580 RepID=A0A1W0XA66_HYPEX|nr:hypothetical protein BV898_01489 [Hypsibius exemplaris]
MKVLITKVRQHFVLDKLRLQHDDPHRFYRSEWSFISPFAYTAYRVILALYFLSWFIISVVYGGGIVVENAGGDITGREEPFPSEHNNRSGTGSSVNNTSTQAPFANITTGLWQDQPHGWRWTIYLTNWTFTVFNVYLLIAAVNVAQHYFTTDSTRVVVSNQPNQTNPTHRMSALSKTHWVVYNMQAGLTIMVCFGFWTLLVPFDRRVRESLDVTSIHVHLLNGIVTLGDIFIVALPINLFHVMFTYIFAGTYIVFSLIFWGAGGTPNPIYGFLNYGKTPAITSGLLVGFALVVIPLMWLGIYGLTRLRHWLSWKYDRTDGKTSGQIPSTASTQAFDLDALPPKNREGLI